MKSWLIVEYINSAYLTKKQKTAEQLAPELRKTYKVEILLKPCSGLCRCHHNLSSGLSTVAIFFCTTCV